MVFDNQPATRALAAWSVDRPESIVDTLHVPARTGTRAPWPSWVPQSAIEEWRSHGIDTPWAHQVAAAEAAHSGQHVALATGTASGKSLAYAMPIVASLHDASSSVFSDPCALYLAPTKALAGDQLRSWEQQSLPGIRPAVVDGDTDRDDRAWARRHANVILTNPDMLHFSLLPGHERWSRMFRNLRYIVVDEAHAYRGVFGAHVALVIRRLRRIAAHYRSNPTVIAASATTGAPERSVANLIGSPVVVVTEDSSPAAERTIVLWQPGPTERYPAASATRDAAWLTASAVDSGSQVLTFLRSRRATEYVADLVRSSRDADSSTIAAYRGGYLAEERRALESGLRAGTIRALATTNALELGIDVAGVDVVITTGWPGTRASLWQQFGRAGRADAPAASVFVAREDPLDSFIVEHPQALVDEPVEETVFDVSNPYVLRPHLCAAAAEIPIVDPLEWFPGNSLGLLDELTEDGLLRRRPTGWYWTAPTRAHDLTDLRGSGETVRIVEAETGRLLGTIDAAASHRQVHPGAVYVHQGITHVVETLDLEESVAIVVQDDVQFTTFARDISDIRIVDTQREWHRDELTMAVGTVDVSSQTVSFERRGLDGTSLGVVEVDLPQRVLRTQAVWWTFTSDWHEQRAPGDLAGAVHAAEHAAIGLLPLFASCDRWDIGGVSTEFHPDTGATTIFIYDGVPGGAGFTSRGADMVRLWIGSTLDAVRSCRCVAGCPACIQSPKCGNGNEPLNKAGSVIVLETIAGAFSLGQSDTSDQ